ncbi:ATP-dependent DNA helicase PIF1 [Hirsutella rhossiliensis]|uniref:ATP-dependent DNA helicase PIF1 n=1 Tax=Hirsutella rhossiliensis TaxID=111463 RepID=A0A9P8SQ34_9HYPO|nr:ATP-dependent DNA helicase PIF1 [Hirsutella rhossiliensis]KAH0968811.1 ATP-dependent DNA helicase PIF1 [Hirsutella rhossiliensis]
MPRSAQTHHQMPLPSIRRTPIDEFNRSQPLLTLAFPTLYPDGKADFVEPRLRSIAYQDYLGHAMRWHDGRFARHKTWPFVALNTLLQEAMAEPDEPEAQDLIQSITRQAAVIRGTRPYCAADYHWESLYRHMPRFQEWKAAPEAARMVLSRQLLRDNAHIAAYHFHKRYTLFRTIVLKQKFNLTDFWGRYEWQGRGSSHHHGLYWLSGHPDLDPDNDQSREQFARIWGYHISAVNPEPQRIQHWNFRGERNDGQINHYNRLLTVAWLANTDVSPCTSLQQVIDYAAKYCSKSEKKSESFAQIGKALMSRVKDHNPLISFTSKLLNQLVAERDYSKQEVSHLLLGLPLQEGSRTCLLMISSHLTASFLVLTLRPSPIVGSTTVMVMTIMVGQKRLDYSLKMINTRLCLWRKNLMMKTGFASPPFTWEPLTQEDLDLLGRRDIDVNYDWTRHVGTYPELRDGYWKDLIASHPMANDVEVLGPHWRNTLNPQQRLVYDTFMGHFQAKNPTQILLHVDGGGGTGKSFLIKAFPQRSLEFFGGMSVLLVGDFFQLPPVRQKPLYSTSTSLSALERRGHVAYRLFDRTVFLTTVQRQAGDDQAQFRQALQELREVKLSIPSWNLLSSRVQARLTQSEVDSFKAALRVYSTRARVEAKNQGKGAGQAPSDNAGNLSNKFPIAKGARVMLTTNLWQPAGLVNGAQGTIPPAVIMVDFDSYDGPPYLTTNEGRKISPILPSLTKDQIVTDLATRDFQAGISYAAVSRVTSLQGLLLEAPFDRQSLYNHTPTEGMKMRLADQQRRQGQQLTDAPYTPRYLD